MERVAVRNSFFFQARKCVVKVRARQRKRQMIIAFRAPRCELDGEILTDPDDRKWSVLAFQLEPENVDIEIDAGSNLVDVEYYVINGSHGSEFSCRVFYQHACAAT